MDSFQLPLTFNVKTCSHVRFSEHTGAAQIDCDSAFLKVVAVPYMGAFTVIKSLCTKCKLNHV